MFFDNFAGDSAARAARAAAPALARRRHAAARLRRVAARYFDAPTAAARLLDRLLYADMKTYLVELLMKQDQMSMAASIESRVPFLDHKLVEFAAALPDAMKLHGFTTKRVLREAMKGMLPESILDAAEDGLPGAVRASGLRGALERRRRATCCSIAAARERGIIDPAAVERLLDDARGRPRRRRRPRSGACSTSSSGTARSSTATACRRCRRPQP